MKITYATLSADNEELQSAFDDALARARADLGKTYPMLIGDEERTSTELFEDRSPIDRDMVVAFYRGNQLDLGLTVREQLFLALPMKRLCRADCAGLCPTCGVNRNEVRCDCPPEPTDPRLAPLKKLLDRGI